MNLIPSLGQSRVLGDNTIPPVRVELNFVNNVIVELNFPKRFPETDVSLPLTLNGHINVERVTEGAEIFPFLPQNHINVHLYRGTPTSNQ